MSKAVHWQVPFCSLKGVQYRVDIYDDDYTGSPVQLTGGATPFVTDEDNDDNFFAPVRTQTGQLTVIDMDGTLMETLIPSDNTARPVRLIRVSDSTVMWQGFLSCEAYSQDYTSRAQELTLNVNSVLAAMESVKVGNDFAGFKTIKDVIVYVLGKTNGFVGSIKMIDRWYMPSNASNILTKYIDTTVFFDEKEQSSENSTTYVSVGLSCTEVLRKICAYMGWTARESGMALVFCSDDCNTVDWYSNTNAKIGTISKYSESMPGFDFRGTGHMKELRKGAKSVEVVAKVDGYDVDVQLPDCPSDNIKEKSGTFGLTYYYYYAISKNIDAYNICRHTFRKKNYKVIGVGNISLQSESESNVNDFYTYFNLFSSFNSYSKTEEGTSWRYYDYYYGAILSKCAIDTERKTVYDTKNALVCCFCAESYTTNGVIFSIESNKKFVGRNGVYISIDLKPYFFVYSMYCKDKPGDDEEINMYIRIQIGDYYWDKNNGTWTTTPTNVEVKFNKDGLIGNYDNTMPFVKRDNVIFANTGNDICGKVKLSILECRAKDGLCDSIVFSDVNIGIQFPDDAKTNDRSENHYFKLLTLNDGTPLNFSDEVSVNTDLASDMNNKPSPSVIMNSETEPMTTLTYSDGTSERPEKHLLNRLAAYYGAVRRKITLEIDRPSNPLPLTKVTGYDNRTYLPLAESRDWRMDKSTVTMYETT